METPDIAKSHGKIKKRVLAIARIMIPLLIVILCIGIMMHVLKQKAEEKICGARISSLARALLIYTNQNDQPITPEKWCDLLIKNYNVIQSDFRCSSAKKGPCNYALNKNITQIGKSSQEDIVLLFETHPGWNQVGGLEILTTENHSRKGCYIAFCDLHVEFVKTDDIKKLKWKPD
ncbi:MAG: hypothetical protein JXA96_13320 [Sedimentisphaerales bacterium]|nr:hypothetical protein [Sedimentisphaerales bacterium]